MQVGGFKLGSMHTNSGIIWETPKLRISGTGQCYGILTLFQKLQTHGGRHNK